MVVPDYEDWLKTRPPEIQEAARRFPPMSTMEIFGQTAYVVGWVETEAEDEDPAVLFTFIDPNENYEKAIEERFAMCAKHLASSIDEDKP